MKQSCAGVQGQTLVILVNLQAISWFQGFKDHQLHNVLVEPGSADLTADVDFGAISRAAQGEGNVLHYTPTTIY